MKVLKRENGRYVGLYWKLPIEELDKIKEGDLCVRIHDKTYPKLYEEPCVSKDGISRSHARMILEVYGLNLCQPKEVEV